MHVTNVSWRNIISYIKMRSTSSSIDAAFCLCMVTMTVWHCAQTPHCCCNVVMRMLLLKGLIYKYMWMIVYVFIVSMKMLVLIIKSIMKRMGHSYYLGGNSSLISDIFADPRLSSFVTQKKACLCCFTLFPLTLVALTSFALWTPFPRWHASLPKTGWLCKTAWWRRALTSRRLWTWIG